MNVILRFRHEIMLIAKVKINTALLSGLIIGLGVHSFRGFVIAQAVEPKVSTISGVTTATISVPVGLNKAWDVLTRYESTGLKRPDIKKGRVLSRDGNQLMLSQTYQAPYTFGLEVAAVLQIKETPKKKIEYELVKGELIRQLTNLENQSRIE